MRLVLSAWCLVLSILSVAFEGFGLGLSGNAGAVLPPRNSQVQVARRFWLAVLRHDDRTAYAALAADVRQATPLPAFRRVAARIRAQQRGRAIELYKLGFRLEDDGRARPFVAFRYAADSAQAQPRQWLDVTFRDTAARAVWRFERRVR